MEPESLGRRLGIGVRVASRIAKQRMDAAAQQAPQTTQRVSQAAASTIREQAPQVAQRVSATGKGARRFGQAIWGPFVHVAHTLSLEVFGVFFALFALFFGQAVYKVHTAYATGADHTKFLLYGALTVLFSYFSLSSFLRARRKDKKKP